MAGRNLITQAELAATLGVQRSSVMRRLDYKGGPIPTYAVGEKRFVDKDEALELWTATKRGQGGHPGANPVPASPGALSEADAVAALAALAAPAVAAAPNLGQKTAEIRLAILATKAMSDKIAMEKERGSLVDKNLAVRQVFTYSKKFRDALINLPSRVGREIAAELGADPVLTTTLLERHIRDFLTDLAEQRFDIG